RSLFRSTGVSLRPQDKEAARLGVYERRLPMFSRIEPDGPRWDSGAFEPVDAILWATGFRPAVTHLAPLHLRSSHGGIPLLRDSADVQTAVTAAYDPRVQLVGYGPSASTIGASRAGRAAALAVRRQLAEPQAAEPQKAPRSAESQFSGDSRTVTSGGKFAASAR
ncbi:pyridine nucleotide-disulfide oxidoreductase, partial [Nocardioides sp. NPDC000441]